MAWTEQQQNAIEVRDCGIIVSAAAGSGKTSVLVERLLRILMEEDSLKRVPADRMIVVTFTNDAAAEMKARLSQALEEQLQKEPENRWLYQQQILLQSAHICTISSFCFELIRDNLTDTGITSGFRILNDTESRMMTSKAANQVLNQWHMERSEDMELLWDCFCEKSDFPLEQILLELHQFLGSVPFRDEWCRTVINLLEMPLEKSVYHQALMHQVQQMAETAVQNAREAAALASGLYDTVKENTVLPWVEQDCLCLEQLLHQIQQREMDSDKMIQPFLEKNSDPKRKQFPRKKKNICSTSDYERIKQLRSQYADIEKMLISVLQTVFPYEKEDIQQHLVLLPLLFEMERELSEEIWKNKVHQNALGFDDGERMALELLSVQTKDGKIQQSPLAEEMASFYQLIMIDEYQDTNNKQDTIFKLLSRNCIDPLSNDLRYGNNVFLVGDVKQSIYRFRLANPQNFVHAIANSDGSICKHIALNRNFRSTPAILNFVNCICGNLMSPVCGDVQYDSIESLQTGSAIHTILPEEEQAVHIVVLQENDTEDVQVQYVTRQIQRMIQNRTAVAEKSGNTRPCQYSDFCVLLRNNTQCSVFSHAMENAGIPVQSPEEKGYLQAREISILLDMLRVLDNPLLDTALAAIMLSPMFWFTAQELMQIRMDSKQTSLYTAICQVIGVLPPTQLNPVELHPDLLKKCRNLYETIQKLRQNAIVMPLESLIRRIYDATDFLSVMQLTQDGERKRANLHLLLQYAKQYEENTEAAHSGVSGFLRYIDWLLESGNDFQQTALSAGLENAVSVKTMHRSKGLEYPFVFLGKLEVKFSHQDKQKSALFSDSGMAGLRIKDPEKYVSARTLPLLILEQENQKQMKSEELRLLYVAMTRAKQQLFLPLNLDSIRTKRRDYLSEYASSILPSGEIPPMLVQSAGSMAHWIWMCMVLLHDSELHALISLPEKTWDTPKWVSGLQIHYESKLPDLPVTNTRLEKKRAEPDEQVIADVKKRIAFQYQSPDSQRESLLSVSAIQAAQNKRPSIWKRPYFLQESTQLTGAERGTAIHTFFQYADFHRAEENAEGEVVRLQQHGFLTKEQAAVIKPEMVRAFLCDPLYLRLCRSKRILREKKFLVQCKDLSTVPHMEEVLQQYYQSDSMLKGIIDLAFWENDAYVLVDYKTDVVSAPNELIAEYREQITLYHAALHCITGLPVHQCYLYSTHLKRSIEVSLW